MKTKQLLLTAAIIGIFILNGCAKTPMCPPCVTLLGDWEIDRISIVEISEVENSGNHIELQITGISKSNNYHKMEYRIDWLDGNGQLIPTSLTTWTAFPTYGRNAEFRFKATAPTPAACDYRILIRKATK
jgi:uncharacterized protein DUF1425